jgi:alpha-2-macroglobulin-like protein
MKFIVFLSLSFSCFINSTAQNNLLNEMHNEELVYVQTDRPFYEAGEEVWYTVWLLNSKYQFSDLSSHLRIILKDPKGNELTSQSFFNTKSTTGGKFVLPKIGGIYTIEVAPSHSNSVFPNTIYKREFQVQNIEYVDFLFDINLDKNIYSKSDSVMVTGNVKDALGNFLIDQKIVYDLYINGNLHSSHTSYCNTKGEFSNTIQLNGISDIHTASLQINVEKDGLNASKYKHIPLNEDQFRIALYPEGGNLVHGVENTIAFNAVDLYGKPTQIQGRLLDSLNHEIASFKSQHDGMGTFRFSPNQNQNYRLEFWTENSDSIPYDLPSIQSFGNQMNVLKNKNGLLQLKIHSSDQQHKYLFIKKRNDMIENKRLDFSDSIIDIDINQYAMGIYEIDLLNTNYELLANRLVFINPDKKLNIKISFEKELYNVSDMVKAKIEIKDHNNQPVEGHFTIAVVKEQMLQYSEKHRANILSDLYLLNDLNADIHLPGQYFEKTDSAALAKLDLLMLTHPISRPYFNLAIRDSINKENDSKDQRFVIRGNILKMYKDEYKYDSYRYLKKLELKILNNNQIVPVDSQGNFAIWGFKSNETIHFKATISNWYKAKFDVNPWLIDKDIRNLSNSVKYSTSFSKKPIAFLDSNNCEDFGNYYFNYHTTEALSLAYIKNKTQIKDLENGLVTVKQGSRSLSSLAQFASGTTFSRNELVSRGSRIGSKTVYIDGIHSFGGVTETQGLSKSLSYSCISIRPPYTRNDYYLNVNRSPSIRHIQVNDDGFFNAYVRNTGAGVDLFNSFHLQYVSFPYNTKEQPLEFKANYKDILIQNKQYTGKIIHSYSSKHKQETNCILYLFNQKTNSEGIAEIAFFNGYQQGAYSCQIESISNQSEIGCSNKSFNIKSAFYANFKTPERLSTSDHLTLPLSIQNNFDVPLSLKIHGHIGDQNIHKNIDLLPFENRAIPIDFLPRNVGTLKVNFYVKSESHIESFNKELKVYQKAFKNEVSISGVMNGETNIEFLNLNNILEGEKLKIDIKLREINPNNLLESVERMIHQPSGCFEQVSSTNYPNILAYQLLKDNNALDLTKTEKYFNILNSGYQKLAAYETKQNGFEWYGNTPPHEGLSAYGLLQFYELKELGIDVSELMLKRTIDWLESRYNKDGSINVNWGKYGFSGASEIVTSAYVTWALSEIGQNIDDKKINHIETEYKKSKDLYIGSLLSKIYFNTQQIEKGRTLLEELMKSIKISSYQNLQASHSIVRSYGTSLDIEILSMVMIDLVNQNMDKNSMEKIKETIIQKCNSRGYYGNTQSTIWALKALIEYNKKYTNRSILDTPSNNYQLKVVINSDTILYFQPSFNSYNNSILYSNIKKGLNQITVLTPNNQKLSYMIETSWIGEIPNSQTSVVKMTCEKTSDTLKMGAISVRNYVLQNTSKSGQGQTVCVIPIPAGMTLIPENLKLLKEKKVFDYYEIIDGQLIVYYAEMGPNETKNIPITFQADYEGEFYAPAAYCYLYYYPENTFHMYSPMMLVKK